MKNTLITIGIAAVLIIAVVLSLRHSEETGQMPEPLFEDSSNESSVEGSQEAVLEDSKDQMNEENTQTNTFTTAGGVKVEVLKEGEGAEAKNGDMVNMNYTGRLTDGTVFDSNVDPKFNHVQAFVFPLGAGQVIRGWEEGVLGMKKGEKRVLTIPSDLAYGPNGIQGVIPGGATLVFEVEVMGIN